MYHVDDKLFSQSGNNEVKVSTTKVNFIQRTVEIPTKEAHGKHLV